MTVQEFQTATHIINSVEQTLKKTIQKRHIKHLAEWLKKYGFEFFGINWWFKKGDWLLTFSFEYTAFDYFHVKIKKGVFTLEKDITETLLLGEEQPSKYLQNFVNKHKILEEYMTNDTRTN